MNDFHARPPSVWGARELDHAAGKLRRAVELAAIDQQAKPRRHHRQCQARLCGREPWAAGQPGGQHRGRYRQAQELGGKRPASMVEDAADIQESPQHQRRR